MIIERLSILNFKNIPEAELVFSPKINYLFGNNGMGKTNLLDALYYLSFTKNHNNLPDSQLIHHGEEFCVLQGYYTEKENTEEVYCGVKRKHKKVFKRNKKEYERLSEHIGLLPLVMISPADIDLIQGGSEERRKFVDVIISQYDKEYLRLLIHYNRILLQRNTLLKQETFPEETFLQILDEQLTETGMFIFEKREEFAASFTPLFKDYYNQISKEGEQVNFTYYSRLQEKPLDVLLKDRREKDRLLGYTSAGIHKDDFDFLIDDFLIRKVGSQGQNKTYLIALKLAQFSFLSEKNGSVPILLLDDIFDKLDSNRVGEIIRLVSQPQFGQIFITDTNRQYLTDMLPSEKDYKLFFVERGNIIEQS